MANFIVEAEVRTGKGTAASRRARRDGKVPVVVYGGGEDEQYLLVEHHKMMHQLEVEAFHSALVQLKVGDDLQRAVLRDVHMHPYKAQVLHLDFQRVSRKDTITMTVPLHFKGEEDAPGVKLDNGIMTHNMVSVDVTCLGIDLPEYVEVDVSELNKGDSVHLGEITLPEGVELAPSYQEQDMELAVASVLAPKGPSAAALAEEAEAEAAAEAAADTEEPAASEGDSED
jgi:large subunit ribosomal protein L25